MSLQVTQILRQGVWAALTGGWYHDPNDSQFNNICHLYLWIILLVLPLAMHLGLPQSGLTLGLYCIFTTLLFAGIKFVSFQLHLMFDEGTIGHPKSQNRRPAAVKDAGSSRSSSRSNVLHDNSATCSKNIKFDMQENPTHQSKNPTSPETLILNHDAPSESKFPKKHFYKLSIFPGKWVKVWYDRITLLALLDKTENIWENIIAILLAICVSFFGFLVLHQGLFKDFWVIQFCFVIASCQFCLLKSVQPDPASPIHGYNQIITYSRPAYFCILCSLILLLNAGSKALSFQVDTLYGFHYLSPEGFQNIRDQIIVLVNFFPVISLLGLFPQVNTFFVYMIEQIDILVFGGSATSGFVSASFSLFRSTFTAALLSVVCHQSIKEPWATGHIPLAFSYFFGLLVAISYHLSQQSSDLSVLLSVVKYKIFNGLFSKKLALAAQQDDPFPQKLRSLLKKMLSDLIICTVVAILAFAASASTLFLLLRPFLGIVLLCTTLTVGFLAHYVIPQLRKHHPWLCLSQPVLKSKEYKQREVIDPAQLMWFETVYTWFVYLEKYILYPSIILHAATIGAFSVSKNSRFGQKFDAVLLAISGLKLLRSCFCNPTYQHLVLGFTILCFHFDYYAISEGFLIDFYFMSILFYKIFDLVNKMHYVLAYIAPWQVAWGSSFHVFAQLFAIPHSAMLFIQAVVTSILSIPLSPFLGSVIFVSSYARPIKFWEKNSRTVGSDSSNTKLKYQLEKIPGNDYNNLNSIFYEHLTRSLQHVLCGDLILGRWGNYDSGDYFILTSDYLNALVHLIEVGNGYITFQLRGLELKGTYCHQRELEAISEGYENNEGCCCFQPSTLPHMLSCKTAFNLRWQTWEIMRNCYILEGYNVISSNAASILQVFDLRKMFLRFFVKSIIYFTTNSPNLPKWIRNEQIHKALQPYTAWDYVEHDLLIFNINTDEDYIPCLQGITRASFCSVYLDWIQYCAKRTLKKVDFDEDSFLVTISFGLCILGRRLLGTALYEHCFSLDAFLHGLHSLFKGQYQISKKEEWVFVDMDLLHTVISPAVRIALKLHQNHFVCPEDYEETPTLFNTIRAFEKDVVICDEEDPVWRASILSNKEQLLTLRHMVDEENDDYNVIMLQKSYLMFKVIKVNKECVRGLWAGQQQELIFLRNRDHERGSIQNNKHVLRNLISSSCDQPLGYPIYVSPITTSYQRTHYQFKSLLDGIINFSSVSTWFQTKCMAMTKQYDRRDDNGEDIKKDDSEESFSSVTSYSESNTSQSSQNSHKACNESTAIKSIEVKNQQLTGKCVLKNKSSYKHGSLNQISSVSGANTGNVHSSCNTLANDYKFTRRLSSSQHCVPTCAHSTISQAHKNIQQQINGLQCSGHTLSTNSTLSLLFGKKGFSSALVLSGLSGADGENTTDTMSSSSVNIEDCSLPKPGIQTSEGSYATFPNYKPPDNSNDPMLKQESEA